MSWNDYYARRAIMDNVVKQARRDPAGPLPFAEIDRAAELFGTPEKLLQALYYRWNQVLLGHLRSTVGGPEDIAEQRSEADNTDLVADAWRTAVQENKDLRAVLDGQIDRYPEALLPALESEQRTLALTAGLAEPYEPAEEITRVGASFLALIQYGRPATKRRGSRPHGLLRLLSPAS